MSANGSAANGLWASLSTPIPYRIRILLADDHPIFRDGLCKLLALEDDFDVVGQTSNGQEVLDAVKRYHPDILLLDLSMPGLGGLSTLQTLQDTGNKTRVILLTASEEKADFVQAMKLGASGIVLKQTATELLNQSIRKVHAGETWLDPQTASAVIRHFVSHGEPAMPAASPSVSRERDRSALSPREREIVALVAQSYKNKEMAEKLFISEQTVKNHLHNIFDKLAVTDRLELALFAIAHNLATRV
jgi:DNA-binding NarL/FixJ family response regulator